MSEWVALLALAYGLYLIECLAWIDSHAWASFVHPLTQDWRSGIGEQLPGNERGGILAVSPLEVSGALVVCRPWPFSISPYGVSTAVPGLVTIAASDARYIPFDSIESVTTNPTGIQINGESFVRVSSSVLAVQLADLIERIRQEQPHNRSSAIEAAIRRSLDREHVTTVWTAFQQRTWSLIISSSVLFGYVFVVVPAVLFLLGPYPSWQYLLAGLVLATIVTAIGYYRAHTKLYPRCRSDRWTQMLSMMLLPVGAIRAVDKLSRDALCEFSPVVVVPLLCGNGTAIPLLRQYAIDLSTPAIGAGETPADTADSRCAEWYRRALSESVDAALEPLKPDLVAPPPPDDASMARYCPRCHAQFGHERQTCADCPGVQLFSFDAVMPRV